MASNAEPVRHLRRLLHLSLFIKFKNGVIKFLYSVWFSLNEVKANLGSRDDGGRETGVGERIVLFSSFPISR